MDTPEHGEWVCAFAQKQQHTRHKSRLQMHIHSDDPVAEKVLVTIYIFKHLYASFLICSQMKR